MEMPDFPTISPLAGSALAEHNKALSCTRRSACRTFRGLELILLLAIKFRAETTRAWAHAVHESLLVLLITLPCIRPSTALLVVVETGCRANTARVRTLPDYCKRVGAALARIRPDVALGYVMVDARWSGSRARAEAARVGALLGHPARVRVAFAVGGPPGAVLVEVLARLLASAARHRAVTYHELGVVVAPIVGSPSGTLKLEVDTLGVANATTRWAGLHHELGVGIALPVLSPRDARLLGILALKLANVARKRAHHCHSGGVLGAFAVAGPIGAVGLLVVADSSRARAGNQEDHKW